MPEGIEVKIITEQLRSNIQWRELSSINIIGGRFLQNPPEHVENIPRWNKAGSTSVNNVGCRGKFIYIHLSGGWYIWNTLGMTGHWGPEKSKHSAIELTFTEGPPVYFTDPRHFGTFKLVYDRKELNKKLFTFGFDFLNKSELDWNDQYFLDRAREKILSSGKTLVELLMDQSIFAGVGNYIKSEALHLSKLSPWRTGESLSHADLGCLFHSIGHIFCMSYAAGGATLATYKHFDGSVGKFSEQLKVYKKKEVDGFLVRKETTPDKRSTFWVPELQK